MRSSVPYESIMSCYSTHKTNYGCSGIRISLMLLYVIILSGYTKTLLTSGRSAPQMRYVYHELRIDPCQSILIASVDAAAAPAPAGSCIILRTLRFHVWSCLVHRTEFLTDCDIVVSARGGSGSRSSISKPACYRRGSSGNGSSGYCH